MLYPVELWVLLDRRMIGDCEPVAKSVLGGKPRGGCGPRLGFNFMGIAEQPLIICF